MRDHILIYVIGAFLIGGVIGGLLMRVVSRPERDLLWDQFLSRVTSDLMHNIRVAEYLWGDEIEQGRYELEGYIDSKLLTLYEANREKRLIDHPKNVLEYAIAYRRRHPDAIPSTDPRYSEAMALRIKEIIKESQTKHEPSP